MSFCIQNLDCFITNYIYIQNKIFNYLSQFDYYNSFFYTAIKNIENEEEDYVFV